MSYPGAPGPALAARSTPFLAPLVAFVACAPPATTARNAGAPRDTAGTDRLAARARWPTGMG